MEVQRRRAFIGRGAEIARLHGLLDVVSGGVGATVVVGGEAGIGKSRLIERFTDEVSGRALVVAGACLEVAGESLPYGPFAEILRELVHATPRERVPALLGAGRAELSRLLPELSVRTDDASPSRLPRDADRLLQARLFERFLALLERLAGERPLVVVVEDVHWADQSTCDLLGFLVRGLRDDPVLFVLTTRTGPGGAASGNLPFLAELEREDDVERLELGPFDRDEISEQVAALVDEPPSAAEIDELVERTDGNPFYVEELTLAAAGAKNDVPPVLRDVLAARVAGLSPAARDVLRVAAAAGRRIDDDLLASVLETPPRELAAALREALASGILTRIETRDGPLSTFRHGLLQEAVAEELFPAERASLHAAFARALEARVEAGDQSVPAAEVARHWDAARMPDRALAPMIQAAIAAERAYAFAEALGLWERAAAIREALADGAPGVELDVADALQRAADCAVVAGDPARAVDCARRALVHLATSPDQDRAQNMENRLRWYLWWSGQRDAAAAAVRRALDTIPAAPPSAARARVLAQQAGILMDAGDYEGSKSFAREAIEMGRHLGRPEDTALAFGVLGWDLALLGDVDAGIEVFRQGQEISEKIGSVEGIAIAVTNLARLLDRVGRSEAALQAAADGYATVERLGIARTYGGLLLGYAAKSELALGRWDDADRSTALGLRRGAVDGAAIWLLINRALLLTGRGRFDEAARLLRRARAIDDRLAGTDFRTALLAAEAELAIWQGRPADVVRIGSDGLATLSERRAPDPSLAWLAALVMRAVADADRASLDSATTGSIVLIRTAIRDAESQPGFAPESRADALVALLHAEEERAAGRADPAAWRDVGDRWAALGRPYAEAYARFRHAEALLAARGAREEAAAALGRAAALAGALGAAPLHDQVRRLATQARIPLDDADVRDHPMASDPYHFTAREAEVLSLVAGGWTNQQIADALFITRKTASVHVSNILGKLGVENRGEAAAMAHRLGLVEVAPLPGARG